MAAEVDRIVKDALAAIDSAKTKVLAAGMMLAAAGLKDHKAVVHLRGVIGGLGCARDALLINPKAPAPAAVQASKPSAA